MLENPYDGKVTFKHHAEFQKAAVTIAHTAGVRVIDCYSEWQRLKKEEPKKFTSFMNEWIHPNAEGHIFY